MKLIRIIFIVTLLLLFTGCTEHDPLREDVYTKGSIYIWDGSAYQEVALSTDIVDADIGGIYGINVETLSSDKTLTAGVDEIYQYFNITTANPKVTLDTSSATAGDRFFIRCNSSVDNYYITLQTDAPANISFMLPGTAVSLIYNGTTWVGEDLLSAANYEPNIENFSFGWNSQGYTYGVALGSTARGHTYGVGIGYNAQGNTYGTSIGYNSRGYNEGVGIGYNAYGYNYGVGIGYRSLGANYGTAIGYYSKTNSKYYSNAIGYYSKATRYSETTFNIDGETDQENNLTRVGWSGETSNNTPTEIFCGGTANQRCTIHRKSSLAFTMRITAYDNTAGHAYAAHIIDGCIKRDNAGNTTMVTCNVIEDADESTDWTVTVTADDTYESLKVTVTGDPSNIVQWAVLMDGVETKF
jgi:hypothetical protein